jgi:hypothetical protein
MAPRNFDTEQWRLRYQIVNTDLGFGSFGSKGDLTTLKYDFRYTPESRLKSDIAACRFRTKSRIAMSKHHSWLNLIGSGEST